jgi:hypothetical protein
MNNQYRMMMAAQRGMGELGDVHITGQTRPRVVGSLPGASNSRPEWWQTLIGAGTGVLNTWLVTRPGANPYALNPSAAPQPTGMPVYNAQAATAPAQAATAPAQQIGQGIGDSFSSVAGQFGVSSTTLVLLAVAGVFLFTRK